MNLIKKYAANFIAACALFVCASAVFSQVTGNVPRPIPAPTVTSITGSTPVVVTPTGTVFDIKLQPCAVGQLLQWAATPAPAGYKCTTPATDLYRDRGMPNQLMTLSGVATFDRSNFLKWTQAFFILGGGRGAGTLSTAGFYQITMPPVGAVIQGVGGVPDQTLSAAGINMRGSTGNWSVLYAILNAGGSGVAANNFRLAGWQTDFVVPDNWVVVAAYNADLLTIKLGNGQILKAGSDSNGAITPFDATVDFNQLTPTTAGVVFTPNTPASSTVLYVSTVDGSQWTYNGTAYLTMPASPDWRTTGNAATNQAINFIGTVDNVGFSIRTNNRIQQSISALGNVSIGTPAEAGKLHVALGTSDASPVSWNRNHVVFGQQGPNGSGLGIGYNAGTQEAWISTLAPGAGWRPLRFHGAGWKFVTNGANEALTIALNGNVGVNQPLPTNKFDVNSSGNGFNPGSNDRASIKVGGSYGGGVVWSEGSNRAAIWSDAGSALNFSTGGTAAGLPQKAVLTPAGNFGLGVGNPAQRFELAGNIRATGVVNYASTAAAVADAGLLPGVFYSVTTAGVKQLYVK